MVAGEQARLFGVLGDPVDHSCSPAMQNAAFAVSGMPHLYLRYRVAAPALAAALSEARALAMGGLNLTVPLKEVALPLMDDLTPEAMRIGAVNTVVFSRGGSLLGHNTDGLGFLAAVRRLVRVRGARAVVIGAGGSARAVAVALHGAGCRQLVVANRTPSRAAALVEHLQRLGADDVTACPLRGLTYGGALAGADLVVNTTPLGLARGAVAVRHGVAPRSCLFVDLVYGARPTPFLVRAARAGHPTLDGSAMLLHQGALAFETWTGRRAPRAAMARALRAAGLSLTGLEPTATFRPRRPPVP